MSERKLHNKQVKYAPLRVRFRLPSDQAQWEREYTSSSIQTLQRPMLDLSNASESQRHAQQIKELLRLNNLLRADLSLNEVLQQFAASITIYTGFRILVVSLLEGSDKNISAVAFSGLSDEEEQLMRENTCSVEHIISIMRPEFRVSQSYFVPHGRMDMLIGVAKTLGRSLDDYEERGGWHPEDVFMVPLVSPREQKLLGFLWLDDPEDGEIPSIEQVELIELFANQAAIAIDNANLFREREDERIALEEAIVYLREDMEQIQGGNLRHHVRSTHPKLQPIGEAVNTMVDEISSILGSMQLVVQAVDEHTRSVQRSSEFLVRDTSQQERQVNQIAYAINDIAEMMRSLSERATVLSKTVVEAIDITVEAQSAVDRAVEGMGMVREATMQSSRTMKRLSESGQQINKTVLASSELSTRLHHLALNAAIESTRANENGKGFAAIAQEIRALAINSAQAAQNISNYIRTLQQETTAVSQSVEQNTHQVVMQTELVTQTGIALDAISVVTEQLSNLVHGICVATDNQSQGSLIVVGAVAEIRRMTGDVTQHMREMQQSLDHLVELTDSLRSRMATFRMNER